MVKRQDAISLGKPPLELAGQLSIWQLITPQSDIYEKGAELRVVSPRGLRFAMWRKFTEALRKLDESRRFSQVFAAT